MTNKQAVEKRIRELVPELQELSFGCEVSFPPKSDMEGILPEFTTRIIKKIQSEPEAYALELDVVADISNAKIIGHPIHLEHILLAIQKSPVEFRKNIVGITYNGHFIDTDDNMNNVKLLEKYDLTKPFDQQSDDVFAFLASILQVKE